MKSRLMRKLGVCALAMALGLGGVGVAFAASFGNSLNGASSVEVLHVRYDGAAWNYSGSGYTGAWFKYSRGDRTLLRRQVRYGRVEGSVWDNLFDWSDSQITRFNWGRL